ncbi:hypothetical protein Fmac_012176 [Flemingia macrophylla]|uniref:Uncharacterized protein n=1 Tax=Flemingia macrophylla TaxID=520843 RepID=A0ABD1MRM8_9FABA
MKRVKGRVTAAACLLSPVAASVSHVSMHGHSNCFILIRCHLVLFPSDIN